LMRTRMRFTVLAVVLPLCGCGGSTPAPAAAPAGAAAVKTAKPRGAAATTGAAKTAPAAAPQPSSPPEAYTYQAGGRRDPFVDVLNSGPVSPRPEGKKTDGVAGLLVNEITVRITVGMAGNMVAMVQAPDGRNYNVHQGDKLADGTVKAVTPEGLVIMQDVNDPLSTAKQREVRKLLRSLEEAKQ
jgi:Tfp pilus assembly protein PilP